LSNADKAHGLGSRTLHNPPMWWNTERHRFAFQPSLLIFFIMRHHFRSIRFAPSLRVSAWKVLTEEFGHFHRPHILQIVRSFQRSIGVHFFVDHCVCSPAAEWRWRRWWCRCRARATCSSPPLAASQLGVWPSRCLCCVLCLSCADVVRMYRRD